jgi:serine protease Do
MSDENWGFDRPQDNYSGTGNASSGEQGIVDSTAEVIGETAQEPAYASPSAGENNETAQQTSGQYESYQAGNSYSGSEYAHADAGSATGNGSYQYSTSHEYYQGENYGSSVGSGSGGSSGGGRGKGFLAVILAIVFGVCIGAGFWGVHRYVGNTNPAETQIAGSAENNDKVITGENTEGTGETPAQDQQQQPAEEVTEAPQAETPQAEAPQAETPQTEAPQAETPQTEAPQNDTAPADNSTMISGSEGVVNDAGLIISDEVKPETELTKVVNKVMPSIVSVYNDYTQEVQNFFGETYTMEGQSTGSGIIIGKTTDELLIVTNNHVVEGADNLSVMFIDQETCDAEIKGTDAGNDLAVIAVSLKNIKDTTLNQIKIATLGNSDALKIGEDAIAIGNALGYGQSVTTGIVSAINREINDDTITGTFIQTDAAINPGNSGGALVDINGNVIGINSSKIGGATVEGMGFAIPISRAIPIIEDLMSRETLTKVSEEEQGTIGISGVTVTSDVSKAYKMPMGVYVAQIIEGGGAASSDLQQGDIITAINGQSITGMEDLQRQLQYYKAGTEVTLTVQRQDGNGSYKEISVKVTLGTRASIQAGDAQNGQEQEEPGQNGQGQGGPGRDDQGRDDRSGYESQQNSGNEQQNESFFDPFEFFFGN